MADRSTVTRCFSALRECFQIVSRPLIEPTPLRSRSFKQRDHMFLLAWLFYRNNAQKATEIQMTVEKFLIDHELVRIVF